MMRSVACPTCGKQVEWSEKNRWRPFCSERCRLIDLGDWLSGANSIPEDIEPDLDSSSENHELSPMPPGRAYRNTED